MRKITIETVINRLSEQLTKDNGCLIWHGTKNSVGHPIFNFDGKVIRVAALNYYLTLKKPMESGIRVKMKCGNQLCCEPSHVQIKPKIDEQILNDILTSGESQAAIAKKYGFTQQYISAIRRKHKATA